MAYSIEAVVTLVADVSRVVIYGCLPYDSYIPAWLRDDYHPCWPTVTRLAVPGISKNAEDEVPCPGCVRIIYQTVQRKKTRVSLAFPYPQTRKA